LAPTRIRAQGSELAQELESVRGQAWVLPVGAQVREPAQAWVRAPVPALPVPARALVAAKVRAPALAVDPDLVLVRGKVLVREEAQVAE